MKPIELFPQDQIDELVRLYKLNPDWVQVVTHENDPRYSVEIMCYTELLHRGHLAQHYLGLKATSAWLGTGPKFFHPTIDQTRAFEKVDINLTLADYKQPYPAIMVKVDVPPFESVLCYYEPKMMVLCCHSKGRKNDIVTTISNNSNDTIEKTLRKYDADVEAYTNEASQAMRIACNCCLALTHFDHRSELLYKSDVQRDEHFVKENSERGKKARKRLQMKSHLLTFVQNIKLHRTEGFSDSSGDSISCVGTHWRRGHWANQAYGVKHSLRKMLFRQPVLVKAELFDGDLSNTETTYKG